MKTAQQIVDEYFHDIDSIYDITNKAIVQLLHEYAKQVFELAQRPTIGTTYRMNVEKWEFENPTYESLCKDYED